jgi:DNA-binding MarR family transcriptional regulator
MCPTQASRKATEALPSSEHDSPPQPRASNETSTVIDMASDTFSDISRALEALFRLNSSRKVHSRQAVAAGTPITQPGFVLLRRIQEDGPLSLGELARHTEMDPAACGRQIRLLEAEGLVKSTTGTVDKRRVDVQITGAGAEVRRRLAAVQDRHMDEVLDAWSERDRSKFAELLGRFVADLRAAQYQSVEEESEVGAVRGPS